MKTNIKIVFVICMVGLVSTKNIVHSNQHNNGISDTLAEEHFSEESKLLTLSDQSGQINLFVSKEEDGKAIYQGDIIIGDYDFLTNLDSGTPINGLSNNDIFGLRINGDNNLWPEGVVFYKVHDELVGSSKISDAIEHWVSNTDLQFELASESTTNFVQFTPGTKCASRVGMFGGQQFLYVSDACMKGNIIHEIGHLVGLHHEQARNDRSEFVSILSSNVMPGAIKQFQQNPNYFTDINTYCYESIMHYGKFAFSKEPSVLPTIRTLPEDRDIGQREALAACDVATITELYSGE